MPWHFLIVARVCMSVLLAAHAPPLPTLCCHSAEEYAMNEKAQVVLCVARPWLMQFISQPFGGPQSSLTTYMPEAYA